MEDFAICPQCGSPGIGLGILGKLFWSRCRNCGWTFGEKCSPTPEDNFSKLISDAAHAVETIDANELEKFACAIDSRNERVYDE